MLLAKETANLHVLAKTYQPKTSMLEKMRTWLREYEQGRYSSAPAQYIYRYYDTCRLQRSFLRYLQSLKKTHTVIAGIFAVMQYEYANGNYNWTANDIDIWVSNEEDSTFIVLLYQEMVLEPLGLEAEYYGCTSYQYSGDTSVDEISETDTDASEDHVDANDTFTDDTEVLTLPRLKIAIQKWCNSFRKNHDLLVHSSIAQDDSTASDDVSASLIVTSGTLISRIQDDSTLAEHSNVAKFDSDSLAVTLKKAMLVQSLEDTVHYLPWILTERPYRPVKSVKIRGDLAGLLEESLTPINIIQIHRVVETPAALDAAYICGGFDLSCCCVALQVDEDLKYHTLFYEGAEEALQTKSLHLRSSAFCGKAACVPVEMQRIQKYLQRGFKWR